MQALPVVNIRVCLGRLLVNVELRSARQTSALDLLPIGLALVQLVGDRYRHGNVALVLG